MNNFEIIFYERENGDVPVENFLLSLDCKMRAKLIGIINILTRREQEIPLLYKNATEKVVSLVSQGVKYMPKCSLIIKYC